MRITNMLLGAAAVPLLLASSAAFAEASPPKNGLKPIADVRLRYESVDQGALEADAVTLRLRAGAELKQGKLSFLAEGEGTLALVDNYNAFPFVLANEKQSRPQFATIADPQNLELNRLQIQYRDGANALTVGRQRIALDDQRWVGNVGWRQNEQTFDAVRGEAKLGPVSTDLTYAINQHTVFGQDAGPRTTYDGHFIFAQAGSKLGPLQGKLFAYLLDYDEPFYLANSSQTYGGFVTGTVPLGGKTKLNLKASYARQSDYRTNPFEYAADYWNFEGGSTLAGFTLTAGWEQLGSDNGRGLQTPLATLHKFNGWADLFLTTPANGLEDAYLSVTHKFDGVKALPGLNAAVAFHQFDSAKGDIEYGTEWDASIGAKFGKLGVLAKYADYDAVGFGVNTRKFWLQAEYAF